MRALNIDSFRPLVSFTFFSWCVQPLNFPMKFAIFQRPVFANIGGNGINGGIIVNRQWVDERGNPASWKVVACLNQPLAGTDEQGERGEEQA